jgi:hypothetical protein
MKRRIAIGACAVVVLIWTYMPARASVAFCAGRVDGSATVVYPTGQFPTDVDNVQAAVNLGGTLFLKATDAASRFTPFNFGPAIDGSGTVFLNTNITIRGETVGGHMTTILGGDAPFRSYYPVHAIIHELYFDGPRIAAALVIATTGFEFSGSHVARVVPFLWYRDPDIGDVYKGQGIWVEPLGSLSGTIAIEDNIFEDCGLGGAQLGYGLAIVPGEARVSIARNLIRGANLAGIILIWPGAETVIEDNSIVPGPGDTEPRDWGNGIHLLGAWRRVQDTPVIIRNNEISAEGPGAHGIFAFGDEVFNYAVQNTVIERNRITMNNGWTGIGLWGKVGNSNVRNNRISGNAEVALMLGAGFFDPTEESKSNVFTGNNIATFESSTADVFFDTNTVNNVLQGHSGSVIDLGTGNRITGTQKSLSKKVEEKLRSKQRMMHGRPGLKEPGHANHP